MRNQIELSSMTKKEIVELINTLSDIPVKPNTFNTKAKAIDRYRELLVNVTKPVSTEKKQTKKSIIRQTLLQEGTISRSTLAGKVGSCERSVHIMIARINGPKDEDLTIIWNKKNREYTLIK